MIDVVIVVVAFVTVIVLENASGIAQAGVAAHLGALASLVSVAAVGSWALGLPKVQLKSYEARGMARSAGLGGLLGITAWGLNVFIGYDITGSGPVLLASLFMIGSVLVRLLMLRLVRGLYGLDIPVRNVLIYGAGTTGMQLALALRPDIGTRVIGFVDDNKVLQSVSVAGLPVFPVSAVAAVAQYNDVKRILLAMPSVSRPKLARIARRLGDLGLEVHSVPSFAQLVGEERLVNSLEKVLPDAFLGRKALDETLMDARDHYAGKCVLVSGAGGSIGSELCRQVLQCNPARLVLLEASEHALYQIQGELSEIVRHTTCQIVPLLGTVTNRRSMTAALETHGVQIVIHAAAYKHVPLVEGNVLAGVVNNVFGTVQLAQAAAAVGVDHFVLVSTDKAVRPVGTMGATKRLAELVVADLARSAQAMAIPSKTVFCMVRFGNVLGSSGSVIPRFQEQITSGGPVTLTHPDMTRYFMTMQEATQLVLRAGAMAQGGEVFLLDMGEPVRVADLARRMIEAAGYTVRDTETPSGDIEIAITALRPGEKLTEQVSITQRQSPTRHPKIFVAEELGLSASELQDALGQLRKAVSKGDVDAARKGLMHWVAKDLEALAVDGENPTGQTAGHAG
ncbi:polysaccharide biosynthesis protein [Roseibaca sp. V10]|uniref:Polysaccharide biosynthesis protein n=1 Tax=Roseinatronobacter domitianus TaxID=2940293 RepID=A0ABT0M2H5_9RHOB|nr:nucleoside-diphosphate sugar epimerase/dehydratase [Roseibaca domitiana]MCL1629061.1 polysaccharide biosynthesis protein [Roseibaca domitiana]